MRRFLNEPIPVYYHDRDDDWAPIAFDRFPLKVVMMKAKARFGGSEGARKLEAEHDAPREEEGEKENERLVDVLIARFCVLCEGTALCRCVKTIVSTSTWRAGCLSSHISVKEELKSRMAWMARGGKRRYILHCRDVSGVRC